MRPLSGWKARERRSAARRAPNPRGTALRAALNLITIALAAVTVALVASGRDGRGRLGWILFGLFIALEVIAAFSWRWRWRLEVTRADAIYGPQWRTLTQAERARRWNEQRASDVPAGLAPSDPANPYSTPTSWYRP
jgi:hypothetical protein